MILTAEQRVALRHGLEIQQVAALEVLLEQTQAELAEIRAELEALQNPGSGPAAPDATLPR